MRGYPEEEPVGGDGTAAPTVADLSLANIERASAVIPGVFLNTPQFENEAMNAVLGCRLTVKIESLNPIASFKARGAYAFVSPLAGHPHLVCATAGNFGQGLAHAARAHGLAITIFTSADIPPLKLQRMQRLGADVRPVCRSGEEALDAAAAFAIEQDARLVEDGRDPAIAEGAGTIGMELCKDPRPFDEIVVPMGDGALIAGIARWTKTYAPATRICGVCASGAPAMRRSFLAGRAVISSNPATIAEGLAVSRPFHESVIRLVRWVDDVLLVDDEDLIAGVRLVHEHLGLAIEPSGAAGIACVLRNAGRFSDRRIATVLTGGCISPADLRAYLQW